MLTLPHVSHITRKRGVYYWRRRFPAGRPGEVAVSLRTRHFREAEHRAALLTRGFGAAWARATVEADAQGMHLNDILRDYLRALLDGDASGRLPLTFHALPTLRHGLGKAKDALAKRNVGEVAADVALLAETHGFPAGMRYRLGIGLLEARVGAYQAAIARATGDAPAVFMDPAPAAPLTPEAAPSPPPAAPEAEPPAPPVSALVDAFLRHRVETDKITLRQRDEERATLRRFVEVAGDKPPARYQRRDLTDFFATLKRLPQSYGKSPRDRGRTVAEIVADPLRASGPRLGMRSLEKHLNVLRQFFRFTVDHGHLTVNQRRELVDEHRFGKEAVAADKQRDAFTSNELSTLFASPVWTGRHRVRTNEPGPHIIRDWRFWLPLLALYQGARMEELAALRRKEIVQIDGVWALKLEPDEGRRLKNKSAKRTAPLHPEVLRLGFVQHVMAVTQGDDDAVFPDLAPRGKDQRRGVDAIKWFTAYRRRVGLGREGITFHSFRHTAITRLTDAITDFQQKRHRDFMMGHSAGGGSEGDVRYDHGAGLHAAAQTLGLLQFPELDLRALYVEGASDS